MIADNGNGRVVTYDPATNDWSSFGAGTLAQPTGVAADLKHRILVADGRRLARADDAAGTGQVELVPPRPRFAPAGVAVQTAGRIAVADAAGGALLISDDPDGTSWSTVPLPSGPDPCRPWGVAPSPDGGILVTDVANARVLVVAPDSTVATVLEADDGLLVPVIAVSAGPGLVVADAGAGWVRSFLPVAGAYEPATLIRGRADGAYRFDRIGGLAAGDLQ